MTRPRRLGLAGLLAGLGWGLCFAAVFGLALFLHVGLPPGKRVLSRSLVTLLERTFLGDFEVGAIEHLSTSSVVVERFVVRDPEQRVVLDVRGLRVRAGLWSILRELLEDDGKVTIAVEHTRIERVRVVLEPTRGSSELGLVLAFTPRPRASAPAPASTPAPRVWLGNVEIGRGRVQLKLTGLPALDGEVTGAKGQVLVSSVGVAVDAARFSAVVRGLLAQEVRAVGSFHQRGTTHFWSSLDGYVGDLQFDSIVRLDGKHLKVTLDVPRGEPAVVRALLPAWPLTQTATAHVDAEGDLPTLRLDGTATVGDAKLGAKGSLVLSPDVRLMLDAHGEDIDLRALFPSVPPTRVAARATLALSSTEQGVELTTNGETQPTVVEGVPVPGARFQASYGIRGLSGTATLHEPGMPLDASFVLREDQTFEADVRAASFELSRAPRLAEILHARGMATLHLKGRIEREVLDATLSAEVSDFQLGALRVARGRVKARARGSVARPQELRVDGTLDGTGVRFGELAFDTVETRVSGPIARLALQAKLGGSHGASVVASTRFSALGGTRFDDVDIAVTRDGKSLHARAERIQLAGPSVELANVRLDGAGGTLVGSGRYRPGLLEVDARGDELDLGVLSQVLGWSASRLRGKLDLNAELAIARDVRRGTLNLGVRDAQAGALSGVTLDLATSLEGENLEGDAVIAVDGIGRARSSFATRVPGSLLERSAWERATGRWDFGLERLELSRALAWLPASLGLSELGGAAVAQLTLLRASPDEPPDVTLLAATDGLVVVRAASEGEPLRVAGIEAQLSASVDGKQSQAQADLRLLDTHGLLASASARLGLDMKRLLAAPEQAWELVRNEPIVAALVVDGRPLANLPEPIRPPGVAGTLRGVLDLRGTLTEPQLAAKASIARLAFGDSPEVVPFDACGTLQYDPKLQRLGLGVQAHLTGADPRACSGPRVVVGSATGTIEPTALARGERGFRGEVQLGFEDFPLELVPALADSGMAGRVRGSVALTDTGELPALSARLRLAEVSVRGIPVGSGDLTLRSDGRALRAGANLERAGGTLQVDSRAALSWDRSVPALDRSQRLALKAEITNIDAAVLSPVVGEVLADLSGRLDGTVELTLAPETERGAAATPSELSGKLSLSNGSLQLAGLGMRLSKVRFDALTRRTGNRTVISVRGLSAASGAEYANVSATADLYLNGLTLYDGRANVNLREVPLMIEGVSQAKLTGGASLALFADRDPMLVAISLHDMTASLPRSSGRAVLDVDDNPDITVKQLLREPLREARGGAVRWRLAFDLARKVKVTRADMEIPLRGRPVVDIGDDTDVSGDLELEPGGRVQLLGKGFLIESGEVHFDTDDPADPHLRVLASWRAPDATVVYVEVGGTVREATLRLTSDPSLSQAEIQALLLGGGAAEGGEAQAAGIGYGADFVGQLLADTPLRRVELRTASETTADDMSYSTYTAALPISENVWVELSYKNLETSGPAEHSDAASATVDWRFKRDWSLRTEAGTIGTGLDLLWQYRY
jgi:translocation and assembly module TamB